LLRDGDQRLTESSIHAFERELYRIPDTG
jgi:hypothetical protein